MCARRSANGRFRSLSVLDEIDLEIACQTTPDGTEPRNLFLVAQQYGLTVQRLALLNLEAEVEAALHTGCPVCATVPCSAVDLSLPEEDWHTVLIVAMDAQEVYLNDPADPR